MIVSHETLLFSKTFLDIINEYFWNCPSKQLHSLDYSKNTESCFFMENYEKCLLTLYIISVHA